MLRRSRLAIAGLSTVVAASLGVLPAGAATPATSAPPAPVTRAGGSAVEGSVTTITLVTGDRVRLMKLPDGSLTTRAEPAEGRARIGFVERRNGDRIQVIPTDAAPLLASGALDPRLFDVTGLAAMGYDDARRSDVPVILQYADTPRTLALPKGASQKRLGALDAVAVRTKKADAPAFWSSLIASSGASVRSDGATGATTLAAGVKKIWLDGMAEPALDQSVPQVGAPSAWEAGFDGTGVTVAVLDTGIDTSHPDLAGRIEQARNFTDEAARDTVGHGTHVASTIAGTGAASQGKYKGVAPGASLLDGKVCTEVGCQESAILAGMEWAATSGAEIVNMSLSSYEASDGTDLLSQGVDRLTAETGTLFVVATGNDRVVGAPGAATSALTVGAVDKSDQLARFSGRGPRLNDYAVKPDLTGPGVAIAAARADGTTMGEVVEERYVRASGTSMATPHVAGAAAILAQQHPTWKAGQLKPALTGSAERQQGQSVFEQGSGRLDVGRAVSQQVSAASASVSAYLRYPHPDPATRTLTYRNDGDTPVTLALELNLTGPDGGPMPASAVTLDTTSLTVPAHAEAKAVLTVDPAKAPTGLASGWVTARSGDLQIQTSVGVMVEPESYDLTIRATDRDGLQTGALLGLADLADGKISELRWSDGAMRGRIEAGAYSLSGLILSLDENGWPKDATLLGNPKLVVDRDLDLAFDARQGHAPGARLPDSKAKAVGDPWIGVIEELAGSRAFTSVRGGEGFEIFALPSPTATKDRPYTFLYAQSYAGPDAAKQSYYNLAFPVRGQIPARLTFTAARRDLAEVSAQYGTPGTTDGLGARQNSVILDEFPTFPVAVAYRVTAPAQGTEYFTADRMRWSGQFWLDELLGRYAEIYEDGPIERFAARKRYTRAWNTPAFGPSAWATHGATIDVFPTVAQTGQWGHRLLYNPANVTGGLALARNGKKVGESDIPFFGSFEVPADEATYTLDYQVAGQMPGWKYATKLDTRWTFRSARPAGDEPADLPLLNVKVSGAFDALGRAPLNKPFPLSVRIERPEGGSRITSLSLEVSYDDGKRWQSVPVTGRTADGGTASVRHPSAVAGGFVSLRVKGKDASGNAVEQTVIRSYGVAPRK
ncbi:S8 family serine peptidase [Actinopolymorpha alba]|uniref:S8 family serine peptidase n=1 Tax=Actinopolymorpha alba TaxID=533267 RepID=UPI0004763002|nr:S8 family serine peptidase [Actinopolymorpha alba]